MSSHDATTKMISVIPVPEYPIHGDEDGQADEDLFLPPYNPDGTLEVRKYGSDLLSGENGSGLLSWVLLMLAGDSLSSLRSCCCLQDCIKYVDFTFVLLLSNSEFTCLPTPGKPFHAYGSESPGRRASWSPKCC